MKQFPNIAAEDHHMISEQELQSLIQGRHADPFACLGMHQDASQRLWIRCFVPGAQTAAVSDARSGQILFELNLRHPDGFFEGLVPRRRKRFDYRLHFQQRSGQTWDTVDPYAFGPLLSADEVALLGQGQHPSAWTLMGAHLLVVDKTAGCRFVVWAPNARMVSVVGDFNAWDSRRHPMRLRHDGGLWELFIPGLQAGSLYKFSIIGPDGSPLPWKADPWARQGQLRPETASVICPVAEPTHWPAARAQANDAKAPISIYEVHPTSWNRSADEPFPDWDSLAATLPRYVADLGFTHLELMPITEYPFDGSWGYQTLGLFAPTARLGSPQGFARFVRTCHDLGLGVILDWVPAHFPVDDHGLSRFDGSSLYEYSDPREGFHQDWNTLIYQFGRREVRQFLISSALYWLQEQGIDGLRVDAVASMLYRDYSRREGQWIPNHLGGRENLEAIELLKGINGEVHRRLPGRIMTAEESTSFPGVSRPVEQGGLGFHFKWNMGWMNDTLAYMHEDPVHRSHHHHRMTFGLVYAFNEHFVLPISHDEVVHGKGSMLSKMPGDEWQKRANLRAYYGFMWGHPGKKLLFMGQEFGQITEWNHEQSLPWSLLQDERHAGIARLVGDLNRFMRQRPALHRLDGDPSGFEWRVLDDASQSVLAWVRRDEQGDEVLVVCNFTPVPRHGYRIGMPAHARPKWREAINTDSSHYGGSNVGNGPLVLHLEESPQHGHSHSIAMTLPPLATLFLVPS